MSDDRQAPSTPVPLARHIFRPFPDLMAFLHGPWGRLTAAAVVVGAFVLPRTWAAGGPVVCPSRAVTGIPCPGCGLMRAFAALGHGDPNDAFRLHPFAPVLFLGLVLVLLLAAWDVAGRRPPRRLAAFTGLFFSPALVVVWIGWGVVRAVTSC